MIMKLTAALLALLLSGGCSNVSPRWVQKDTETEHVPGLRYYMTRPFVIVRKPFPIQSDVYLATASVSADGKQIHILHGSEELMRLLGKEQTTIGSSRIWVTRASTGGASTLTQPPKAQMDGGDPPKMDGGAPPKSATPAKTEDKPANARIGMSNITATTDLTALPRFDLSDSISLAFLPDYDREFVVETKNKLGATKVVLNMGPGNTLLGFSADVDNSALSKEIVANLAKLMTGGTNELLAMIASSPKAQNSEGTLDRRAVANQTITLRVHRVRMAAQGLYPMVKPSELEVYKQATDRRRYLQPVAGYQIPYDYYEVLLFEALLGGMPAWSVNAGGNAPADPAKKQDPANAVPTCVKQPGNDQLTSLQNEIHGEIAALVPYKITASGVVKGATCHADINVTVSGSPEPDSATKTALVDLLRKKYSGTQANLIYTGAPQ